MSTPTIPGYDLLNPLGAGGSGQVWRARRRTDGLPVAVKLTRPGAGDSAALTAILAEAGLLAGLRHEHVLHLYDVLPLGDPQDPTVAIVTQLAAGGSLAQVLHRRRLLSPGELVTVLHPISSALGDLHRSGVVHGDLSPGNILFRSDGMPLLGDLGTARVAGEQGLRGWGTGGQDGMVSPEVLEGFAATAESDVYQLGAVAWWCLVGEPPGPGFDRPPLAEVAPELPVALVGLVAACMSPQPEDRPAADDLGPVLLDLAEPEPVEVAPEADAAFGLTQRLRQVALADAHDEPSDRGRRWWPRPRRRDARDAAAARGVGPAGPERDRRGRGAHRAGAAPEAGRAGAPRPWVGAVLVVVLLGLCVALLWPGWRDTWAPAGTSSGPVSGAGPAPTPDAGDDLGRPVAPTATREPASPATGEPSPQGGTDPAQARDAAAGRVVQELLDRRATAWEQADVAGLAAVTAPGSEADAQERSLIGEASAQELRYPSVTFEVTGAEVKERDEERMVVDVAVRRLALEVRRGEEVVHSSAETTDQVRVVLVAHGQGWRVEQWVPVSPAAGSRPSGPPAPGPGA